ncbi:family 72 glycoside hydrolase [Cryphonectria parasitica EP155]|uniref:1,3-beta-glucanosyltransferase n=1 Tax=Cryphonectria parasitica (strain ATCC 38755 / EP155) TaxID=660469 RepID=A0A9P5CQW0_CRYP1|nr:family 72 glycoside hydrolase [Cryphonectria parasitica EP155]KAF3766626.1 family 72 glycoside hydrolase [Cryphonectria parasitica EP155]
MQIVRTVLSLLGYASLAAAVPAINVRANYFVNNVTGDRYQIVGVAYQPGGSSGYDPSSGTDALTNKDACLRDAALMQVLGVNAVRVYNINPDLNHDECASIFNAAGIFMLLDVNAPLAGDSINSLQPGASYYAGYLNRTFAVVEAFKSYPNTVAFFAGNEVISDVATGYTVPPYMRAVTRDLKNYIARHSDRAIPVGYSAADVRSILFDTWAYLQCDDTAGDDTSSGDASRVDFFSLNSYSWCGNSSFTESTYNQLVAGFSNSSVPIFLSEYGCNVPEPRVFTEVPVIYSTQMSGVFSGGIVYEFVQGSNNYGLVNYSSDGTAQLLDDFYTLKDRYAALNFATIQGVAPPANSPSVPTCSANMITTPGFCTDFTVPLPPSGAEDIIANGVSPLPSGKIVPINDYTVNSTVKDNHGNVITGLKVVPLAEDQINQPGSNAAVASTSGSTPTSSGMPTGTTSSASATSTPKETSAGTGVRHVQSESIPLVVVSAVVASFLAGFLG